MIVYRELDGPLRTWLRQQQALVDLCGEHIYFQAPDISRRAPNADPRPTAWLGFRRIGGGMETEQDARLDDALVTFDCCGRTRRDAALLSEALVNTVGSIRQPTALEPGLELLHAQVTLWRWQPDGTIARYVVDMALLLRSWPVP